MFVAGVLYFKNNIQQLTTFFMYVMCASQYVQYVNYRKGTYIIRCSCIITITFRYVGGSQYTRVHNRRTTFPGNDVLSYKHNINFGYKVILHTLFPFTHELLQNKRVCVPEKKKPFREVIQTSHNKLKKLKINMYIIQAFRGLTNIPCYYTPPEYILLIVILLVQTIESSPTFP